MKYLKKLGSVLLALVMVLALMAPAFADASITIKPGSDAAGGTVSTEYTYYQLLRATLGTDNTVSYYLESSTDTALKNELEKVKIDEVALFSFTESADGSRWTVTINKKSNGSDYTDSDGEAIAAALNDAAIKGAAITSDKLTKDTNGNSVAQNLSEGYYLITSTLGNKLVLQTVGDVEIDTKNEYITNTKTADKNNMSVGDHVEYTITVNIPATAIVGDLVTVHDVLDTSVLSILDEDGNIAETPADYYITATFNNTEVELEDGTSETGDTFAKQFAVAEGMPGNSVELKYSAELLNTALDDTGYINKVFSNTPAYKTAPDEAKVWTYDFELDKNFSAAEGTDTSNYAATFELKDSDGNTILFTKDNIGYVKVDSTNNGENAGSSDLTVTGGTNINVRGLAAGEYTLTEKSTQNGYNLLEESITVIITAKTDEHGNELPEHEVSYRIGTGESQSGIVTVENNAGTVLPSTGGIGTTIFYIVGGVLVIGAVVLLITKRRTSVDDE